MVNALLTSTLIATTYAASSSKHYSCDLPSLQNGKVKDCADCADPEDGISKTVLDVGAKECIDRQVFSAKFWGYDLAAMFIWFAAAGLATSAGVGGGGIYVPLGIILVLFEPKAATGLSQASIFGASLGGLILNMRNRHPKADRPLIDLDMALFLAPMELAGAVCGVIIQKALPTWLTLLLMFVILGMTAHRTLKKAVATWRKEVAANKQRKEEAIKQQEAVEGCLENGIANVEDLKSAIEDVLSPKSHKSEKSKNSKEGEGAEEQPDPTPDTTDGSENDEKEVKLEDIKVEGVSELVKRQAEKVKGPHHSAEEWLAKDAARPTKKFMYLFIVWIVQIIFLFLKGSKKMPSVLGFAQCGTEYWIINLASLCWLMGFALVMGRRAVSKSVRKQVVNYPFVEGDVKWTWGMFRFYCFWTFVAGIIAGLIGIGGGMVLGPLMLIMGLPSQVSTATTATMVVITSSAVAVGYVVTGQVPWSYFVLFFCITFTGAIIGKLKIDAIVKARNLSSILIFVLGGIILFASVFAFILMFIKLQENDWVAELPKNPCSA